MPNAELQNLANSYASGNLTLIEYRLQRAEILDAFSESLTNNPDSPITLRLTKPTGIVIATKLLSDKRWVAAGIGFTILLMIIGLYLLFSRSEDPKNLAPVSPETEPKAESILADPIISPGTNNTEELQQHINATIPNTAPTEIETTINKPTKPATTVKSAASSKKSSDLNPSISSSTTSQSYIEIENLVKQMLQNDAWDSKQMHTLQKDWNNLTPEEIHRARNTRWFYQLKFTLIQRIAKYRAKASLGDARDLKKAETLTSLAKQLGINDI